MESLPFFCQNSGMQKHLISFLALVSAVFANARSQPNIVFIIADDLGWANVEFHGGNTPTPNLNQLLSEGVELKQHYVAPVCSPTRAGFLTGRYWSRFGITTPINNQGLPFETVTVAKALGEAGYSTALIGKWHLDIKTTPFSPPSDPAQLLAQGPTPKAKS